MKSFAQKIYRFVVSKIAKDNREFKTQISRRKRWLGNMNAGFFVSPSFIHNDSIVYSFGVGEDISFDEQLIAIFGCKVFAFDPTPKSISFVKSRDLHPNFVFNPYGIMEYDGNMSFFLPENNNYVSGSSVNHWGYSEFEKPPITVPVKRLQTIMRELNHSRIDLLKMDIEGSEYSVLEDIINSSIDVKQISVEFHHRFNGIGLEKTKAIINKLNEAGFKIFAISESQEEFSFLKT